MSKETLDEYIPRVRERYSRMTGKRKMLVAGIEKPVLGFLGMAEKGGLVFQQAVMAAA